MPELFLVDPRGLRLPPSRDTGADPAKLQRQITKHGTSTKGMPNLFVYRGSDGELMLVDGVTRATRVAKLMPGTLVHVEVLGTLKESPKHLPTVGDKLP